MSLDTRNAVLDEKLEHNPIDDQIQALVRADRQRKWQLLFLALIIVALAYGWRQNHRLALQAESNTNAIMARCESTNEARVKNARLWNYLIEQSQNVPRTPEQQKFRDDFIALKNDTFAPTDCSKIVDK